MCTCATVDVHVRVCVCVRVTTWLADGTPYKTTVTLGGAAVVGAPSNDDLQNYIVFVEEVDDEDVRLYRQSIRGTPSHASSDSDACVPAPRPSQSWLIRSGRLRLH